jgi:hypothetical protein
LLVDIGADQDTVQEMTLIRDRCADALRRAGGVPRR